MSFVAILNTRSNLDRLLTQGDRPTAVATWSSAVAAAARAHGIPVVLEDDLLTQAERVAIHDRADDLSRALAGDTVPASRDYADWCWWALEFAYVFAFSHGAKTLRLLEAARTLAPDYTAVVHDREGYVQGAVINFLGAQLKLPTFGFEPHTAERDTLHQRLDVFAVPLFQHGAQDLWRGKRLPKDHRPSVVLIHTNEVAHLVTPLASAGVPHFLLCEDARKPWPPEYIGPRLDARRAGPMSELVVPRWPDGLPIAFETWERELAETLAITWQPHLREELGWSVAAYEAGRVGAILGGGTIFPDIRARVLAARELGIPFVLVQHGMLHPRHGGRGERVHHFADHNMVWSRLAERDLRSWGVGGTMDVIGWPQSSTERARAALAARPDAVPALRVDDARPWVVLTSAPLPDEPYAWGERFLRDALTTIRAVDPAGRIVVKHHPFQEPAEIVRALCDQWEIGNVDVVGGLDPWAVLREAKGVVAFKSTAVLCAVALHQPVVVYHPSQDDAMFDRFAGFPVARTPDDLALLLRAGLPGADYAPVAAYARVDLDAGKRAVASLRRLLRGTPAPPRVATEALAAT